MYFFYILINYLNSQDLRVTVSNHVTLFLLTALEMDPFVVILTYFPDAWEITLVTLTFHELVYLCEDNFIFKIYILDYNSLICLINCHNLSILSLKCIQLICLSPSSQHHLSLESYISGVHSSFIFPTLEYIIFYLFVQTKNYHFIQKYS